MQIWIGAGKLVHATDRFRFEGDSGASVRAVFYLFRRT